MSNRRQRTRNNRKKTNIKLDSSFIFKTIILIIIIIIFCFLNFGNTNIIRNVYINGIKVSSLSTEDAKSQIQPVLEEQLTKEILIKFEDYQTTIIPDEISVTYDLPTALEEAYSLGRKGNIITNNFTKFISLFKKTNIQIPISYDSDKLDKVIENMSLEIPNLVVNPSYYITDTNLILSKGSPGNKLDKIETKNLIISSLNNYTKEILLPVSAVQPDELSAKKIYDEIFCEPVNASVTKDPYSVTVEKKGVDFANSIEEVQNMINNSTENEISIPLKYTNAEITVADLGEDIFQNTISTYSTKYDVTNINRATNLEVAVNKINGIILASGEEFSFNKIVGERTAKNGFKDAIIYADGELEYGIGGGICQVSSNLYNSVLLANLEILERKNHSMTVNYVPVGCDATVSYGSVDFKFKNTRSYPIKIDAIINSGVITISIKGLRENIEYTPDIIVDTSQKDDFQVVYENTSSIPKGTEVIKQTGKYGYKCSTYRILYQNGKIISKDLISTDTYKPQKQIIQIHK